MCALDDGTLTQDRKSMCKQNSPRSDCSFFPLKEQSDLGLYSLLAFFRKLLLPDGINWKFPIWKISSRE